MFVIVKNVKTRVNKKSLPVVLLNVENEVWEFDNYYEAERIKENLETNSRCNASFQIKKIGINV